MGGLIPGKRGSPSIMLLKECGVLAEMPMRSMSPIRGDVKKNSGEVPSSGGSAAGRVVESRE
jgi:hypothetical protein